MIAAFVKAGPVCAVIYFMILAVAFTAFALFIERKYGGAAEISEPTP